MQTSGGPNPLAGPRYGGVSAWLAEHDAAAALTLQGAYHDAGGAPAERSARYRPVPAPRSDTAATAVPPGRLGYTIQGDTLLTHSLVSLAAFTELESTGRVGTLPGNPGSFAENYDVALAAYDWMRWQMVQRVPGYTGRYPMWVWVRIRRADLVDSVRVSARQPEREVLLTLRIPREQLVISDFMAWHSPLNGGTAAPVRCPVCGTDWCDARGCLDQWSDPWWDERERRIPVDAAGNQEPWWNWPTALRTELFASWEAILVTTGRWALQGCVEFLRAEWITDAAIIRPSGATRSTRSSSSSV